LNVHIYIEGGGEGPFNPRACREGFAKFFSKMHPDKVRPGITACGSRTDALDAFKTALSDTETDNHVVSILLVDAEGPVTNNDVWKHLEQRDGATWAKPDLPGADEVFLMVQCVESWFCADHEALTEYFGPKFDTTKVPKAVNGKDIECHDRKAVVAGLSAGLHRINSNQKRKKRYGKTDAFEIVGFLDANKICAASKHLNNMKNRLKKLLHTKRT